MKKSNLILGFYVGVIALCVATVSMSIAWYATSTQVRIEGIEMTVDCDRDLGIATKPDGEYYEKLEPEQLYEVGAFRPVTSAYSESWLDNKRDMPVFYDEPIFSTHEQGGNTPVVANGGFYSQKLYLKSNDDIYVTIEPGGTFINPNTEYNKGYAEILYEEYQSGNDEKLKAMTKDEIETGLNNLVKAMRFSILVTSEKDYQYAIIDPNKEGKITEYGGLLDVDRDLYYDHFFRGEDAYERVYGEYEGEVIHLDTSYAEDSDYEEPDEATNAFNAKHKKGIRGVDWDRSKNEGGFKYKEEQSLSKDDFNQDNKPFIIPLYRHQPQEIVLSIYIEGWDLDSINHTKGATFLAGLSIKIQGEQYNI